MGPGSFYFAYPAVSSIHALASPSMTSAAVFWAAMYSLRLRPTRNHSAERRGPPKCLGIQPEIFDFEPDLGLKLCQITPEISGMVPTNRHTTIPNDSGPTLACFDDDPKLLRCEITQPRQGANTNQDRDLVWVVWASGAKKAHTRS